MSLYNIYQHKYKQLLLIPFIILVLAVAQIGLQYMQTGDFVNKGISLKGGITITVPKADVNIIELQESLASKFQGADISVRSLTVAGVQEGVIIDSDAVEKNEIDSVIAAVTKELGLESEEDYTIEQMGPSLGQSFFRETIKAVLIAFILMGTVVFAYFAEKLLPKIYAAVLALIIAFMVFYGNTFMLIVSGVLALLLLYMFFKHSIPSVAVILAAFSDMIVTLAVVNLLGMKMSTAGVAAFLMLIGYSVDTDILLSTRVLKRKHGTILDRTIGAMKTGLTMSATTIAAVLVGLVFAQSEVLNQIMIILLIGLIVDLIMTWLQNAGILRWYLEKNG